MTDTVMDESNLKRVARVMRKVLPPRLLAEVVAHLDPLSRFISEIQGEPVAFLADACLWNSALDEPVFVLVARDVFSSARVREWADAVEAHYSRNGGTTAATKGKVAGARRIALAMDQWRDRNGGKVPD